MEMMGGMFGAAGSIAGAFIAADAQKYSANTNWAIALMNYYARERERTQAKFEAQRIEMKRDEGSTDAQGTTNKYVPGQGWVQTLSPERKALQTRELSEQMKRLGPDAAMRRHQLERNEIRQIKEEDKSKALFDAMRKAPRVSTAEIEGQLFGAANQELSKGFNDTAELASRQALRTNNAQQAPAIFAELARAQGDAQGAAKSKARSEAMQMEPQINAQDDKVRANLYNLFATRAAAMPDVSFTPQAIDSGQASAMARGGNDATLKAAMMEGGRLPFIPPNYGLANAVGATGTALGGLANNMMANRQQGQFSDNGSMGNLWASIRDDVRGTQGSWSG